MELCFRFLNVRNQDVPTYVEHGSADLGIFGLDVIMEKGLDVIRPIRYEAWKV